MRRTPQESYLGFLKKTYYERMVTLCGALRQSVPSLEFMDPAGGYFIWSCLPEGANSESLLAAAGKHKVGFQPGIKFSCSNGLQNYLRFCFAYYGSKDLLKGVKRLAWIID